MITTLRHNNKFYPVLKSDRKDKKYVVFVKGREVHFGRERIEAKQYVMTSPKFWSKKMVDFNKKGRPKR